MSQDEMPQASAILSEANNLQFTPSLYKELLKKCSENFLFSPFSAETVLAFAQSGCKGETAQEIRQALHLPDDNEKIEEAFRAVLPKLRENDHYTLETANKMYIKEDFPIKAEFKKAATEVYNSDSENIDFTSKEASKTINKWVEEHTANKIRDLIESSILDQYTRAILVNALYFKADWAIPFNLSRTMKRDFFGTSGEAVEVDFMHNVAEHEDLYNFFECDNLNAKFLELEFKGGKASMTFVLPNETDGLGNLEKQIDRVFSPHNFRSEIVAIAIPKFKVESDIDVKEILQNLDVETAFIEHKADLSGISGKKGDLFIDQIRQRTFIDVSEQGVEAAAATFALLGIPRCVFHGEKFIADHPFIFYIKIKGFIIFAGRVTFPV